ncbi:radical SAM protein [Patescibacteria group bacterium]|nr:radical SAM protein [Patescibacteria group bacterium]
MATSTNQPKVFTLQWHITDRCEEKCKHCYTAITSRKPLENELSFRDCQRVVDHLVDFCKILNARPRISFTGGDPFLRPDFIKLLSYARQQDVACRIMGNAYFLNSDTIKKLKELKILSYQISIDGLEDVHDEIRSKGSFKRSLEGICKLQEAGIRTVMMMTLSKVNVHQLKPVMTLASEYKVNAFAFARMCHTGSAEQNFNNIPDFSPEEYRKILLDALHHEEKLRKDGSITTFTKKDHLWALLFWELGRLHPEFIHSKKIIGGCSLGMNSFCILPDGTTLACRRFPSKVGMLPKQSLFEIYTSKEIAKYRDITKYKKCRKCELLMLCRGCPAVAHSVYGDCFAPDPQCWKE